MYKPGMLGNFSFGPQQPPAQQPIKKASSTSGGWFNAPTQRQADIGGALGQLGQSGITGSPIADTALSGASTGMAFGGPIGAAIGGVGGAVLGAFNSSKERKKHNKEVELKRLQSNADAYKRISGAIARMR